MPVHATRTYRCNGERLLTTRETPADLTAAIDTVVARFTLEAKQESMMSADPKGGTEETKMLADHKAADDTAVAKLIAGAKTSCQVDIG